MAVDKLFADAIGPNLRHLLDLFRVDDDLRPLEKLWRRQKRGVHLGGVVRLLAILDDQRQDWRRVTLAGQNPLRFDPHPFGMSRRPAGFIEVDQDVRAILLSDDQTVWVGPMPVSH